MFIFQQCEAAHKKIAATWQSHPISPEIFDLENSRYCSILVFQLKKKKQQPQQTMLVRAQLKPLSTCPEQVTFCVGQAAGLPDNYLPPGK